MKFEGSWLAQLAKVCGAVGYLKCPLNYGSHSVLNVIPLPCHLLLCAIQ